MMTSSPEAYRIYLMRHAHAAAPMPGERDFDRKLDLRGRDEAAIVARQAEAFGIAPDRVITSAAKRCQETTAMMSGIFPERSVDISDALYAGTVETYLDLIADHAGSGALMIVGHNPVMEELTEILLGQDVSSSIIPYGFPTAGLLGAEITLPTTHGSRPRAKALFLITPSFSEAF